MTDTKHTPTPWELDDDGDGDYKIISEEGHLIAVETGYYPIAPSIEDAAHIVKCVNMHDELVEVIERLLPIAEDGEFQYGHSPEESEDIIFAREALKKAGAL